MRNLLIATFCVALVLLHISAAGAFFKSEIIPNVTLALVISLVFILGFDKSLAWIILSGLLLDVVSGHIFGTSALLFVIIGWMISVLSTAVDFKSRRLLFLPTLFLFSAGLTFLFDVLNGMITHVSISWFGIQGMASSINYFNWDYILKIIFTAFFVFVIYYLINRMNNFLRLWR
jgi:rod shape-determining protein MreD